MRTLDVRLDQNLDPPSKTMTLVVYEISKLSWRDLWWSSKLERLSCSVKLEIMIYLGNLRGSREGHPDYEPEKEDKGFTQKNAQFATRLLTSCKRVVTTSRYLNALAWLETACWWQLNSKLSTDLLQSDCQILLSTGLLRVVWTSCNKSANDRLQQAWF